MGKITKLFIGVTACLLLGTNTANAQRSTDEVVNELNKSGFWMPYMRVLESDERMEDYFRSLGDYSVSSLNSTLEHLEDEYQRAQELLTARKEIVGKKKGKKQDALLAKRFKDIDMAKKAFAKAEEVTQRCKTMQKVIQHEIDHRVSPTMPEGQLLYYSYHNGNGFAGYSEEINLRREDGKLLLKYKERRRLMETPDQEIKEAVDVEVSDSVFLRVRDMISEGRLYEIGRRYDPDFEIFDASGWSLYITFEKGDISSSGYAKGPDHSDVLSKINRYLYGIYEEMKKGL